MSRTTRTTTVVISSICAEYAASATFRRKTVDCSLMPPSKNGSSYSFYFISKILHCCAAALYSIVAALSPPTASRFRDVIFRRRSLFVDSDFETLPQLYFPSSQPFTTPSVVAAFLGLRSQVASATLSFVVAAFRRLLPSTQSLVDSALQRLHLRRRSLSSTLHDFFRRRSLSPPPAASRFHYYLPSSQPFVHHILISPRGARTDGRTDGRSDGWVLRV